MDRKTYTYNYVPSYIVRSWADKNDNIKYNTAFEMETHIAPYSDMYLEELTNDGGLDPEGSDYFTYRPLVESIIRLSKGDTTPLSSNLFDIAVFLMFGYYTNPCGYGRFSSYLGDEVTKRGITTLLPQEGDEISEIVRERLCETRDVLNLLKSQSEAFLMASYIMDLKPIIVEADAKMGFFLSASPLFFGNPFNPSAFHDIVEPYTRRGAVFFMPLSPSYAVCLFDRTVYKMNETEGRVILSEEDTRLINSYSINVADDICYTCSDEEYYAFKKERFTGEFDVGSFAPSFLKLKNRLPQDKDEKRELPVLMTSYDEEVFSTLGDEKEVPIDFYRKRMDYLYSIIGRKA